VVAWVALTMLIAFGLFNLIMSVYIEKTLAASKIQEEMERAQRKGAVHVAENIRRLLLMFGVAQRAADEKENVEELDLKNIDQEANAHMRLETLITKKTFLEMLKRKDVETLMESLEVPIERASLFDVIDADNSGTLALKELGQGLLHVCSDSQRNDALTCVLGINALHDLVRDFRDTCSARQDMLCEKLENTIADVVTSPQLEHVVAEVMKPYADTKL